MKVIYFVIAILLLSNVAYSKYFKVTGSARLQQDIEWLEPYIMVLQPDIIKKYKVRKIVGYYEPKNDITAWVRNTIPDTIFLNEGRCYDDGSLSSFEGRTWLFKKICHEGYHLNLFMNPDSYLSSDDEEMYAQVYETRMHIKFYYYIQGYK
jgi:hypothetical protein